MKKKLTQEQREARRIYDAEYRKRNKEAISLKKAKYYAKNKEKFILYEKKRYQSKIKDYWSVYILPKANYVGITRNIDTRMIKHKSVGRDTSDYRILHEIYNEEDARRMEDMYHRINFEGGNGRRDIRDRKSKGYYEVMVKDGNQTLYASTKTLEDAYQCRTEFYNQDKNLWAPKFEIDRL
jgi:hypothetical protein